MQNNLNVLIVEDDRGFSRLLQQLATSQGHCVTAVAGASAIDPLVGFGADGRTVEVKPQEFALALCDSSLQPAPGGQSFTGSNFVDVLARAGVVCHGMSTEQRSNDEMVGKGAVAGFLKPFMLIALQDGVVSFAELHADPIRCRNRINDLCARLLGDPNALTARIARLCKETSGADAAA